MEKFERMLEKKKKSGKEMSDVEQEAKMGVVKAMRDMASEQMGKKLGGLKKITVASDSPQGLKEGLAKVKDMMGLAKEGQEEDESGVEAMDDDQIADSGEESPEDEDAELANMSEDEINIQLEKLMAMKKKMDSQKSMG